MQVSSRLTLIIAVAQSAGLLATASIAGWRTMAKPRAAASAPADAPTREPEPPVAKAPTAPAHPSPDPPAHHERALPAPEAVGLPRRAVIEEAPAVAIARDAQAWDEEERPPPGPPRPELLPPRPTPPPPRPKPAPRAAPRATPTPIVVPPSVSEWGT